MIKSDSQLQRDVIDELRWDPSIGRMEIGVASRDGVITVSGNVDSYSRKFSVMTAAERVGGVKAVAEELKVVLPSSSIRPDTDIAHAVVEGLQQRIEGAIKRHAEQDARNITVEAIDGEVTLRGTVRSWAERTDAQTAAWGAPGVSNVVDKLLIQV